MLAEAAGVKKIILACGRTDLRKGIDGPAAFRKTGRVKVEKDPD